MNAHWPQHKEYHKQQKQQEKKRLECPSRPKDNARLVSEEGKLARHAERTGDEFYKRCAHAMALNIEGNHHATIKAWRKIVKEWPTRPGPYLNLGSVLQRSKREAEAAQAYLKAMELSIEGTEGWQAATASAFELLKAAVCAEVPKPEWWNDEALKALSVRVVAAATDEARPACWMRARVPSGDAVSHACWDAGPRTAAEVTEAATWYHRATRINASIGGPRGDTSLDETNARRCDKAASRMLAGEEAQAAAAKAEAADALKMAEARGDRGPRGAARRGGKGGEDAAGSQHQGRQGEAGQRQEGQGQALSAERMAER